MPTWVLEDINGQSISHASIGSDGSILVVTTLQHVYGRSSGGPWRQLPGSCVYVDVADQNNIVCANSVG